MHHAILTCTTAIILSIAPIAAHANYAINDWQLVSDSQLEEMRGGFETEQGLKLAFSMERAVYINGELATTTTLTLPKITTLGLRDLSAADQTGLRSTVQNGPGNSISLALPPTMFTFVQNTLDRQAIQGITTINATLSGIK